jgi:metal-responsive CopG/Arc/MetJ family transcriptional regulator
MSKATIGVSISRELLDALDERRGDIPRSRYISRVLAKTLETKVLECEEHQANHCSKCHKVHSADTTERKGGELLHSPTPAVLPPSQKDEPHEIKPRF